CIAVFRAGHNYYWGATIGAQFTGTFAPEDWWTGKTDCTTTATSCSDFGRKNTNGKPLSLIHVVRTWPSVFPVIAVPHVHGGGVKASWVWCPNRDPGGVFASLFPSWGVSLYPGDSYVDWTGIDGYNVGGTSWTGFTGLFQATYNIITQHVPSKPMVLAEVGS